jgi:hypothetical protein
VDWTTTYYVALAESIPGFLTASLNSYGSSRRVNIDLAGQKQDKERPQCH